VSVGRSSAARRTSEAGLGASAEVEIRRGRRAVERVLHPILRALVPVGLVAVLAAGLAAGAAGSRTDAAAATSPVTSLEGPSFAGTGTPTGTKRAESVVWWNDGSWWGVMWEVRSKDFHIFRLDLGRKRWVDTRTVVDRRANTNSDVLWDRGHLYVASHKTVRDMQPAVPGRESYLYRFSYSRRARRYTLDSGFPSIINRYRTETLVIDRDSGGKLWATWQQDGRIFVNRSLDASGRVWGVPFALPFVQARVSVDDISSLVAFSRRVGIMWSNQRQEQDGIWFSSHRDGAPAGAWSTPEPALAGSRVADDHINLKADSRGAIYAAVKTSNIRVDPLTLLLVRRPTGGSWASYVYGFANDCDNRPVVSVDEKQRLVRMFATGPSPQARSCSSSGGAIYQKEALMESPVFTSGRGRLMLGDSHAPFVHNATVSKRNVDADSILVLAVNQTTREYWTAYERR
jgi:hypothetical protein